MQPPSEASAKLSKVDLTMLLARAQRGDRAAWNGVYSAAAHRLRGIAAGLMRRERPGHLLSPTALVSESYVRLRRILSPIVCREHFFSLSTLMMKRALVDHARRGGKHTAVDPAVMAALLGDGGGTTLSPETELAVRQVFGLLEKLDPEAARAIRLRYIEGFTIAQTSREVSRDPWDVRRDCDFGLQWMADRLRHSRI